MVKKKKNIPELRFPGFKEEWEEKKLGNVVGSISSGKSQDKNLEGFYPFYGSTGIIGKSSNYDYCGDSILVARVGANAGSLYIVNGYYSVSDNTLIINIPEGISIDFIYNKLIKYNLNKMIFGSGQPLITGGQLNNLKLLFPTLPEQEKIASFLSAVDERIQQLSKKKSLLEQYKKGVMQQIFSQKLRFKDDKGNDFPAWEEKKLGDIGYTYNGLSGKTKEHFGKGFPFITYKQIFDKSSIDITKFDFVEIDANEKQNNAIYGDIFFTTSSETPREVGFSSVLFANIENLYLNSFCFGYRIQSFEIFSPLFAQFLFRSKKFRDKVEKLAQGSTRYNLSKNELMKITIELPKLKEQEKIASFLSPIDKKIKLVNIQLEKTKTWKKGLLQKMFV